jgi:hypothetical protein
MTIAEVTTDDLCSPDTRRQLLCSANDFILINTSFAN